MIGFLSNEMGGDMLPCTGGEEAIFEDWGSWLLPFDDLLRLKFYDLSPPKALTCPAPSCSVD